MATIRSDQIYNLFYLSSDQVDSVLLGRKEQENWIGNS